MRSDDGTRAIVHNGRSWTCYYVRGGQLEAAGLSASERLARLWLAGKALD